MGQLKNVLVILASITVMIFVADKFWTKYNLDSTEPTCTNDEVESLLLDLTTEEAKNELAKEGFVLSARVVKENTTTESKDMTYKGKSKYKCNTSVEFGLSAEVGNKEIEEIIKRIPQDELSMSIDRDYSVTPNDLGTTFYVRALKFSKYDLDTFQSGISAAKEKIRLEKEEKCETILQSIKNRYSPEKTNNENIDSTKKALVDLNTLFNDCKGTSSEILSSDLDKVTTMLKEEIKLLEKPKTSVQESTSSANMKVPVDTSTNIGADLVVLNGEEDSDTVHVLMKGNGETCEFSMDSTGGLGWTDCLKMTNSKNVDILCTKKKTMCKTVNELRKATNVPGY